MASSRVPFQVSASRLIQAPADRIYGIVADYRTGHPSILPPPFVSLAVEEGGVGAGTRVLVTMRVMGRLQQFRASISEPEPGRRLVEENFGSPRSVTTFTVEPRGDRAANATISTELQVRQGLLGSLERFLIRRFLEPIYVKELTLLASRAAASAA